METEQDHLELYEELKQVIYTRGYNIDDLTTAQYFFVNAMEQAAFGSDMLKAYTEIIEENPDISLRNLHSFCIGFGIGLSGNMPEIELTKKFH